jgi:hypothetical protein
MNTMVLQFPEYKICLLHPPHRCKIARLQGVEEQYHGTVEHLLTYCQADKGCWSAFLDEQESGQYPFRGCKYQRASP